MAARPLYDIWRIFPRYVVQIYSTNMCSGCLLSDTGYEKITVYDEQNLTQIGEYSISAKRISETNNKSSMCDKRLLNEWEKIYKASSITF